MVLLIRNHMRGIMWGNVIEYLGTKLMSESRQCDHCNESIAFTDQTIVDLVTELVCPR